MKELKHLRKQNEKHFLKKDGTIEVHIYQDKIHYLKNNEYVEIDNTLVFDNNRYHNKDNDLKVSFSKESDEGLLEINKDNHYLNFFIKDSNKVANKPLKKDNKIRRKGVIKYLNIFDNVDVDYQILPNKIKEQIIIHDRNSIKDKFIFEIKTDLNLVLKEDGSITSDKFKIEKPFMKDSNNLINDNIYYELIDKNDGYELILNLDQEWLNSDIKYPVYIDPTISEENVTGFQDTYISSKYPNKNYGDEDYLIATTFDDETCHTLIRFDLPNITTGDSIISAYLNLVGYPNSKVFESEGGLGADIIYLYSSPYVFASPINKDWKENTAIWSNMNNCYSEGEMEDSWIYRASILHDDNTATAQTNVFNITRLVKKWYSEGNNYGILLWSKAQVDDYYPVYFSREYEDLGPYVVINYRNQNGIEPYMEYASFELNGATSYINYVNGNLITDFDLCNTIGGNTTVSLNLFYNTNDVILNNNTFGKGLKLNLYQTLEEVTINNDKLYQYLDGDGTIHYFVEEKDEEGNGLGNYVDEEGLSLNLDISTYTISDKNNNKMIFTKNDSVYYLTKIQGTDNKIIEIIYENNKIVKIIDGFDNEIGLQYETDKIIITSQSNTINLIYDENKLINIQDNIGNININYNDKDLISSIVDLNGEKISFVYYDVSPYKLKKVILYGIDNELGKNYEFSYDLYTTKVKDNKNKNHIRTFNDYGNTISYTILDENESISKGYGKSYVYGDNDKNINKILNDLPLTKYVNNLLLNTSFEQDNQIFTSENVNISFSQEEKLSGYRSLKLSGSGTVSTSIEGMSNQYYTFSFYSKSSKSFKVQINDDEIVDISGSSNFVRNKITTYNTSSILKISFILDDNIIYVDDIQLEEGTIANFYNMIDNSDFRYGSTGWLTGVPSFTSEADLSNNIVLCDDGNRILHFSDSFSLIKKFNCDFKKGDKLYISFWYKNLSLMDTGVDLGYHSGYNNNKTPFVSLGIPYENGYKLTLSNLNRSNDWIFHSKIFEFGEDSNEFSIYFGSFILFGEIFISNISLFKVDGYTQFDYDDNRNLISFKDENDNQSLFEYDENNQLIKMTDPLGNNLHYEYDKYIPTRILRGISPSGIANEIIYDDFGNPIITKIQADAKELTNGIYYIKIKGDHEYLKVNPVLKNVILSEDDCSHEKFEITINDNLMTIDPIFHNNIYISNSLFNNIAFEYIKQEDNSYMLKCDNKYVTVGLNGLELSDIDDKINQCFYFENENSKLYIENSAEYSSDGRFLTKTIDTLFNETSYVTNDKGLITSMTDALDNVTNYTYNTKDQLTKITKGEMEVNYEYDGTLLSKIIQDNKEYSFNYDEFLNTKSVYINNNKLIENNYEENNGNLLNSVYGNNHTISYTYDEFDRILTLNKMNNTYKYYYDNFGNIKRVDSNDNTYYYDYDFSQRLIGYEENNFKIDYGYNELDNLVLEKQTLNDLSNTYLYEHNNEDNITKITNGNTVINYTYDELQRLKERNINNYITKYSYVTNGNRTSDLIDTIEENNNVYKYKYDKLGNIIKIIKNNNLINHYYYDQYNQLIKEENGNETITYEYDNFGNILNKKTYNNDTLLTTDTYLYNNTNWKDQLTKYNDTSITYDAIGNPITIGNINLSWINGRQLNNYTDTTNNLNINYKYNKDGIRTEKNVNGNITKYYVEGNKIIYLQTNNYVLYFIYENDALIGFKYAGNTYYYLKNIQNDILGILNSSFEQVVSYEYDSYGKIKSIKDGLGNIITDTNNIAYINPFRYRSYFYDDETGLYYLNSRYYNPTWGRFINADGILGANNDILSYNLYAYCSNNFINYSDIFGNGLFELFLDFGRTLKKIYNKVKKYVAIEYTQTTYSDDTKLACPVNYGYNVTTNTTIGNKNAPFKITIKDKNEIGTKLDFSLVELGTSVGDNGLNMNIGFNYDNKSYNLIGNIERINRVNLIVDYNVQTDSISTGNYISYGTDPIYFVPFYYKKIGVISNTNYFPSPIPIGAY